MVPGKRIWFPRAVAHLQRMDKEGRPFTLTWHTEPLPFPKHSGFPQPRLTLREIAKIVLRDPRATDSWTNSRRIAKLVLSGMLDLCVVSSRSRQLYLKQKQIPAELLLFLFQSYLEGFTWFRTNAWIASSIVIASLFWILMLALLTPNDLRAREVARGGERCTAWHCS